VTIEPLECGLFQRAPAPPALDFRNGSLPFPNVLVGGQVAFTDSVPHWAACGAQLIENTTTGTSGGRVASANTRAVFIDEAPSTPSRMAACCTARATAPTQSCSSSGDKNNVTIVAESRDGVVVSYENFEGFDPEPAEARSRPGGRDRWSLALSDRELGLDRPRQPDASEARRLIPFPKLLHAPRRPLCDAPRLVA
jgi:hypothetical protein